MQWNGEDEESEAERRVVVREKERMCRLSPLVRRLYTTTSLVPRHVTVSQVTSTAELSLERVTLRPSPTTAVCVEVPVPKDCLSALKLCVKLLQFSCSPHLFLPSNTICTSTIICLVMYSRAPLALFLTPTLTFFGSSNRHGNWWCLSHFKIIDKRSQRYWLLDPVRFGRSFFLLFLDTKIYNKQRLEHSASKSSCRV